MPGGTVQTWAKAFHLRSYAKLTDLAAYPKTATLAKVATTGNDTELLSQPVLPKLNVTCGTGLLVRALKPAATLDCAAATATLPVSKHPAANAITGFDTLGAPVCTAITTVYSAAVPTTLCLEPPAAATT